MKKYMRSAVLVFAACAMAGVAHAQVTLTDIGTTAPTPGPYDISQLSTNGNTAATTTGKPDGLNYYTDNNPPPGQDGRTGFRQYFDPNQLSSAALLGHRQLGDVGYELQRNHPRIR